MADKDRYIRNIHNHYNDLDNEIKERMDHVWDYIIYREITDKKVEKLTEENRILKIDFEDSEYENSRLNRELNKYKKKKFFNKLSGKKRKADDSFNVENFMKVNLKKSKNYNKIDNIEDIFKNILKDIDSIDDIIKLENHENRCQLKKYNKFKK